MSKFLQEAVWELSVHIKNFGIKFGADWFTLPSSSYSRVCAAVPWRVCGGDERLAGLHEAQYPHLVTLRHAIPPTASKPSVVPVLHHCHTSSFTSQLFLNNLQ